MELDRVDLLEMPLEAMGVWNRAAAPHMGCMCVWMVQHSDTTILATALDRSKEQGYLWPGLGNMEHEQTISLNATKNDATQMKDMNKWSKFSRLYFQTMSNCGILQYDQGRMYF